ncbi:MAG: PA14 domain-containing protein [Pirellulales bacterium]
MTGNFLAIRGFIGAVLVSAPCLLAVGSATGKPDGNKFQNGLLIRYEVPRAERVSLAVYSSDGRMVRTLETGRPHAAGKHSVAWDGLDRYGRPLPAGEYTWKLVATDGLRAEFLMQIGQNVSPAWERATGNHEAPVGAAIDATGLYRLGATNEGGHWGAKTDLDGRHLWVNDRWSADPWAQPTVALALLKDRLFELMPNGDLYGYDTKSGNLFTGGNYAPKPWNLGWQGFEAPETSSDEEKRKLRAAECPHDIAADSRNDLIVAAYPQHKAVSWYSAKDGSLVDTAQGFTNLAGIACGNDGTVFAIDNGAVVAYSWEKKESRTVVTADKLRSPWRLSIDPNSGEILVAENSLKFKDAQPHHQVKRFDSAGNLVIAYGKPAGRGDGEYVETDFRGITDVEADHAGGFVVTEGNHTPPRRTARFDVAGKLAREWYGAQHYGIIACPEPANPRFVWTLANAPKPGLVRWEVDYATKSWRVAEIYQDVFTANSYAGVPTVPLVFEKMGRIYIQGSPLEPVGLRLVVYDPEAKTIRPCVCSGERDKKAYLWTDLNDDGKATDDEVAWLKGHRLGGWVDPETLSLYTTPNPTSYHPGQRYDVVRVTPGGTPVYDETASARLSSVNEAGGSYHPFDFRRDSMGGTYGCFAESAKNPNEGVETHGVWYYNSCSAVDRLLKWDETGQLLWSVGRHSPDADHETGSTAMPRGLVGLTHDCIIWGDASDEEAARPTVWTSDGLYVDELLRVPNDLAPKEVYGTFNANEYPCGRLHTDPQTGAVLYFALNSGGGSPVYRITGWNGWHRQEGKIVLKEPTKVVAQREGTGLTAEYFNTPDCTGEPAVTRLDPLVYFNWGKGTPDQKITAETFSVRWSGSYEATTNEDVRFEVRGNFPWRDRGRPTYTKLWLNGKLLIESKEETNTVRVRLTAGQRLDVRLECGFKKGEAAVALSHDTPGLDRRAVLPESLYPKSSSGETDVEIVVPKRPALIAHFDFDEEGSDPLFWSSQGGDVFGRLTGDAKRVLGKLGNGIELNAKGEFAPALFPIDEELRLPATDYSVAFWFKTTADLRLCEAKRYSSYNNRWSDHRVAVENGILLFHLQEDEPIQSKTMVADGNWHHVVTTVGPGGQQLYLDGELAGTGKLAHRARISNRLGLDFGPGGGMGSVTLDEVSVLGRALNAEDARELFTKETR